MTAFSWSTNGRGVTRTPGPEDTCVFCCIPVTTHWRHADKVWELYDIEIEIVPGHWAHMRCMEKLTRGVRYYVRDREYDKLCIPPGSPVPEPEPPPSTRKLLNLGRR